MSVQQKVKQFSEAITEIDNKYIEEAIYYKKKSLKYNWSEFVRIAAGIIIVFTVGILLYASQNSMQVKAYTYDTNEEITDAGVILMSGTISNRGELKGHPLMFYLFGENIATVRFSCKNQQLSFVDWTEQREEYGNVQNFTVSYGEDESEYYYLTIDWEPNVIIRELTDNESSRIANLPEEMRSDIIVMEIVFEDGRTATKAITISLLENGRFFATFNDYEIGEADDFVNRPDSELIAQKNTLAQGERKEQEKVTSSEILSLEKEQAEENTIVEEGHTSDAGTNMQTTENVDISILETAKSVACTYYENTVFEVLSMEVKSQTTEEISFSVCVSKGGIAQEPNRTIFLQYIEGSWVVVSEGY